MSTIKPLVESSSSDRARELLRAARVDRPRPGSARRTLLALGVAASASTVSAGVAAATASAKLGLGAGAASSGSSSLALIAAKWLLVGTLGGVALASGTRFVISKAAPSVSQPGPHRASAPSGSARLRAGAARPGRALPAAAKAPESAAEQVPKALDPAAGQALREPERGLPSATPRSAPSTSGRHASSAPSQAAFDTPEHKLLHDLGLLDAARRALRGGGAAQALSELDHYEAARQTRMLDQEAQLLRIDALLASGDRQRARQLARAYLSVHPSDVHATRLRELLAD